jgi:phosphoserine phosphatase RsbU/P
VKRNKTTIFNELIFNVLTPALVAFLVLGTIIYFILRNKMVESNSKQNQGLVNNIKFVLEDLDLSLEILEAGLDDRMRDLSNTLTTRYFANSQNIESVDLNKIRTELNMASNMEDIYVIDRSGTVVNTTFAQDKGLNLFKFGIEHENYLKKVFANGAFVSERFAIESTTKRLKKYTYQPTADGKYIIELGVYSESADNNITVVKKRLNTLSEENGSIKNVDLFIIGDQPFSLTNNVSLSAYDKPFVDSICRGHLSVTTRIQKDDRTYDYDYIFMDRKNSKLYKGSIIKIVSDRTNELRSLRNELIKLYVLFGLAIVLVVTLLYKKTKVITNPIKRLVGGVNRITNGHFDERVEIIGNNEITTLSEQFNHMIEELESLYTDLEQKVKDRTAEIMMQKEEILAQRDAIEDQKNMLVAINYSLEAANMEITEQKRHVTDSILYAKHIQTAILPPDEQILKLFPSSFIYYKPKDIVSGDFYWIAQKDNLSIIAACDCTGHGVPGAFMSIVGFINLNYAVNIKEARTASAILNELDKGVTETLRQRGDGFIRDGMDLALCCFDFENKKLMYAGANNPLLIIRNNEIIQYDPDKESVGAFDEQEFTRFSQHEIDIFEGDLIYIFSDGYADQFGGTSNKKFMKRRMLELLKEIHQMPMEEQRNKLNDALDVWKGNHEQVDDILVIGVKV